MKTTKVTIIKGPYYEQRLAQTHELLYKIISKEVSKEQQSK